MVPTLRSSLIWLAPESPRSANAVPSVGWPANGSSSWTVKMRTRTPRSRSVAGSRGKMNVVSDRFISRAMACISSPLRPLLSENTASGLPWSGWEVNTSNWTNGSRREEEVMRDWIHEPIRRRQQSFSIRPSVTSFDDPPCPAYPNPYANLPYAVQLLLSRAGVWVAESFRPTRRNAGGFYFSAKETFAAVRGPRAASGNEFNSRGDHK